MFGWNIWAPSSVTGTMIEIPARAPGLAANLWIHVGLNTTDWVDLSSLGTVEANWNRTTLFATVGVEPGDIPVASVGCIGLAGIQRQEQGIFDSDTWGLALDSLAPSSPGSLEFVGDLATAGLSWPGGIWFLADILVLRASLIPPVPVPYGTYPPPSHHWKWLEEYVSLVRDLRNLTRDQLILLRRLNTELGEALASDEPWKLEGAGEGGSLPTPIVKPARVSLKITGQAAAGSAPRTPQRPSLPEGTQAPAGAESKEAARPASRPRKRKMGKPPQG